MNFSEEAVKPELFGTKDSARLVIQMTDDHDMELMESEAAELRERTGGEDWCLAAVPVKDWEQDLTPWPAEPVFGRKPFGAGADVTLRLLTERIIPELAGPERRRLYLCGYSLAGLFALWAGYQTDAFSGIARVSPSVWYPGWTDFAASGKMRAPAVYLSLGDREHRSRNAVMAKVADAIREQEKLLERDGTPSLLEWNRGNHFVDSDRRVARGIAWLLRRT